MAKCDILFLQAIFSVFLEGDINVGLKAIGAGLCMIGAGASSIGEGFIGMKALEGVARNPETYGKVRTLLILGVALDETCGIYALLISFMIIFVLN